MTRVTLFVSLFIAALGSSFFDLPEFWARIGAPVQMLCLQLFEGTRHVEMNSALFCGQELAYGDLRQLLIASGLYHLVVVSGGHLVMLEKWAERGLPKNKRLILGVFLGLYSLMSGWQAPVVRAWVSFFLSTSSVSSAHRILLSWMFCLALHPDWIDSMSLHLSVGASLALCFPARGILTKSLVFWLLMTPLLMVWSAPQPFVFAFSILTSPFFMVLWMLQAILEVSRIDRWVSLEHLYPWLIEVLIEVKNFNPPFAKNKTGIQDWMPVYLMSLALVLWAIDIHRQRRRPQAL